MEKLMIVIALVSVIAGCAATQPPTPEQVKFEASPEIREGTWKIRDTKLFVRDVGPEDAPVLVVLHGGPGGNHLSLRPLEALAPDFRVVLYDQRGTGESDRLDVSISKPAGFTKLSVEQNVEDLEALRKKLGREKISLIGHSWGGALAVFYAAAYPQRVDKLIVYSGGPDTLDLSKRKKATHMVRLTAEERARLGKGMKQLEVAIKGGAPQAELDRLFTELASVMFPSMNCERPAGAAGEAPGRGGFWANQIAAKYVETFSYEAVAERLRQITAPTLLTWGKCEPSPKERLTNLLDYLPAARFVIFEKSGHNALDEERPLFFQTIRAFLTDKKLPTRAYRSREDYTLALLTGQREQLEQWGDRLTSWLYEGRTDEIFSLFSGALQGALPLDKLKAMQQGLKEQLGPEKELIRKTHRVMPSAAAYQRVVRFTKAPTVLEVNWTLAGMEQETPTIIGFSVGEPKRPAGTDRLEYLTKTELRLPLAGKWFVSWGGRTIAQNYHARASDQRFASDFYVVKDGKTHREDGGRNEQYYCFGRPILAAGQGKIVAAENSRDDRAPGQMVNEHPFGNHVILDHGNGEFSFYGHMKQGSVQVKAGDQVKAGQQIGQCGNSGHSSEAHLHFHMQDTATPMKGKGIPTQFQQYMVNGKAVHRGEPVQGEFIESSR